jgi:hypothetical protein
MNNIGIERGSMLTHVYKGLSATEKMLWSGRWILCPHGFHSNLAGG